MVPGLQMATFSLCPYMAQRERERDRERETERERQREREKVGNGNLLPYSCLENPVDREAYHPWRSKESDTYILLSGFFLSQQDFGSF